MFRAFLLSVVIWTSVCCQSAFATDLSGTWKGRWTSYSNGHNGVLKCTLIKLDETSYEARFSGRFFKILPFRYTVILDVQQDDGQTVLLAGEKYLGKRFGTFFYEAEADDCNFVASYTSCKDDGEFVMTRCSRCSCDAGCDSCSK